MDQFESMIIPLGILYLALAVIGLVLTVIWIALPFAVFGIKKRLDRGNELLREIGLILDARLPPPGRRPGEEIRIHSERDEDIFSSGRHT